MPDSGVTYPHRDDVVDYLRRYEQRYQFDIRRLVQVTDIVPVAGGVRVLLGGSCIQRFIPDPRSLLVSGC